MGRREIQQKQSEYALQRLMALQISRQYCAEHKLSFDKLSTQRFDFFNGIACFSQPSNVEPLGLTNDKATMPMPTLIIKHINGDIVFEQTEHTKKYLS